MKVDIHKVIELVLAAANERREAAGMDGRWDDGGANRIREQVEYYRYGMSAVVPPDWQKYANQAEAMSDPEYETYKRLKAKFGDKSDG